jgi:poly(A) polymerase
MKISGAWINTPASQQVAAMLLDAGHQAYFVGGCVRNDLIGAPVSDIDMSTDARPEVVMKLAQAAGLKAIPTGIEHGTITVVADKIPHEITTFRTDVSTDGRRATIAFSDTVEEDARRRDFTMNALYASADGEVHDPVGGLPDLHARKLRFIDDPTQRIREDYLRILRFFRFHAWYGDPAEGLDADGLAACAENLDGLAQLSRERVGAEMIKLLSAKDPAPSIAAMSHAGVLHAVMPGADPRALAPLVHLEDTRAPRWTRRAAALGGDDLRETWRLSKQDAEQIKTLRQEIEAMRALPEIAYHQNAEIAEDVALTRAALFETPLPEDMDAQIAGGAQAQFPVKAADLMDQLQGKDLGDKLKALEAKWIASDFTLTKADLLK